MAENSCEAMESGSTSERFAMKSKMFTKEFALVTFGKTDAFSGGYAVVQKPRPVIYHDITFIEGVHAHGRRTAPLIIHGMKGQNF
jgi:hypothetical protein